MIQMTPQMKVHLFCAPVDFRKGIDGLVSVCRDVLGADPFSGTVFLFRNRTATSVKVLVYDGQGYWLCLKRLSQGKFRHWPKSEESASDLTSREISVLLFNGNPQKSGFQESFRRVG